LKSFTGVGRRFEVLGEEAGVTVVDDYGHHPTEVRAALAAGRGWIAGNGRLIAVFQPHLYSRTRDFFREFAGALATADGVILAPIYAAREEPMPGVDSGLIAGAMPRGKTALGCRVVKDLTEIPGAVCALAKPGDLVMTIGAGSIYHSGPQILARLSAVEVPQ
jgi:UDP-N-acetylmuramate--alanine ligase